MTVNPSRPHVPGLFASATSFLTLVVCASGCVAGTMAHAERARLDVALGAAMVNFTPNSQPNQSTLLITRQIHCQLTRLVEGEVRGEAAQSFVFDHLKKQIVFTLKPGLTFTDGSPVTPVDVANTLNYFIRSRPFVRNIFAWIAAVEADADQNQVRITYRQNPTQILKDLSIGLYPILRSRDVRRVHQLRWDRPVGCGEYKIKRRTADVVELTHRTDSAREIHFHLFPDNEIAGDEAGRYDVVAMPIVGAVAPSLRELQIYDPYQIYVVVNTSRKPWVDRRRRCQALAGFQTSRALAQYRGRAVAADDFFPKGAFGYEVNSSFANVLAAGGKGPTEPMPPEPCVAVLRASVPKSMAAAYAVNERLGTLPTLPILNTPRSIDVFHRSKCDFMVMGLKSNTLDGYEFLIPFNEANTSFMRYDDPHLKAMIAESQRLTDQTAKLAQYRKISNAVAETCTIRPLITLPYKMIHVAKTLKIKGLGDLPLNDVLLKWW